MKSLFKTKSLVAVGVTLAIGLVLVKFLISGKPVPFDQMPGTYECEDFGIPDRNFYKLRITPEMQLIGVATDRDFTIGRLAPRDQGAELEYAMEVVHHPAFSLDPFAPPQLAVYGKSLTLKARRADQAFTETCVKID